MSAKSRRRTVSLALAAAVGMTASSSWGSAPLVNNGLLNLSVPGTYNYGGITGTGTLDIGAGITVQIDPSTGTSIQNNWNLAGTGILNAANNKLAFASQIQSASHTLIIAGAMDLGGGGAAADMSLIVQDQAAMQISGAFDLEDSTLTSSSSSIQLNGGTLGVGFFIQSKNPTSPGLVQGGNVSLNNGTVNASYMFLNGGVLEQTTQVGTNAFLPTINDLSIFVQPGGALFNSNGLRQIVSTPLSGPGAFNGGDGGVQKLGLGTLVLSGLNPTFGNSGGTESTYLGPTIVKGGLLELADPAALGGFATNGGDGNADRLYDHIAAMTAQNIFLGYTPSVTVNVGGAAGFQGGTISGSNNSNYFISTLEQSNTGGAPQINLGGLALDPNDSARNIDYTGAVSGAFEMVNSSLINMSIGALSVGVTYTGTITPSGAGYLLGGGGALTLANGNALTGARNATFENGGTVAIPGTNNYTGATTIKGSYIMADPSLVTQPFQSTVVSVKNFSSDGTADALGLPAAGNAATGLVLDGGTLRFVGSTTGTTNKLFTITPAGGTIDASGTVPMVFSNFGADNSTVAASQLARISGATITGLDTHQLAVGMTVSDSVDGFHNATITGITPNSVTLGTNNFTSQSSDTFTFGNQNRTLTLTGTGTGALDNSLQAGMQLAINKTGSGTWVLAGTNSYTGGTVINNGILKIGGAGALGSGPVTVNGGGTLGGGGLGSSSVSGPTTVNAGGSVVPGDATNMTFQNGLTLNSGSGLTYTLNIAGVANGGPPGGNDLITSTGNATIGSNIVISIDPSSSFGAGTYELMHYGSLTDESNNFSGWNAGFLSVPPSSVPGNYAIFNFVNDAANGNIDLVVTTSVPEPASVGLLAIASVGLMSRRRRRARG